MGETAGKDDCVDSGEIRLPVPDDFRVATKEAESVYYVVLAVRSGKDHYSDSQGCTTIS